MKRVAIISVLAIAVGSVAVLAGSGAMWSYEGATGPDKWGELSPTWAACGIGHYQSPIDISDGAEVKLEGLSASIKPTALAFGLDGPTFAVPYESGSWITINGTRYEIQQFHFHHLSEHTVNGQHYPLEAHVVLKAEGSSHSNAVMGVFIDVGQDNAMLNQFWAQLPRAKNKQIAAVQVNIGDLLPDKKSYYMYEGSMTTPECTQGVRWFVLEHPVQASQAQLDRFIEDLTQGNTNNRPIQPTYGRVIVKSK